MKKRELIEPYELCLCGSGKKYKFCCKDKQIMEFHNPNEAFTYMNRHKRNIEFCLHEDKNCSGKIIKSHSIQNNKILSKLSAKGHVYTVGFNARNFAGVDIKKCGKNDATTSTCFCLHHDTEIFKPIELSEYSYTDEQNFLYAYRAFSKAYYDKLEEQAWNQLSFSINHKVFLKIESMLSRIRGNALEVDNFREIKNKFNNALDEGKYSFIETVTATLDYEIGFATSYVCPLSYDFMGTQISDVYSLDKKMKHIFVNIFPENGKSYILISWLREFHNDFEEFAKQFLNLQGQERIFLNAMGNMMICHSDNFALSPCLYESWSEEKKKNFLQELNSSMIGTKNVKNIGLEIEKNLVRVPCAVNLYEEVSGSSGDF